MSSVRSGPHDVRPAVGAGRPSGAQEGFAEVVASLKAGHAATLDGVWGSSCALAAAALAAPRPGRAGRRLSPGRTKSTAWSTTWRCSAGCGRSGFPPANRLPAERRVPGRGGRRPAAGAEDCCNRPARPPLVVAGIQALLQPVPDREALARQTRSLRVGEQISLEELGRLAGREPAFTTTTAVELPGEFSHPRRHSSTSSPPIGTIRSASNCSATRSSRSAASRSPASGAWQPGRAST